jgi:hypothetical protein
MSTSSLANKSASSSRTSASSSKSGSSTGKTQSASMEEETRTRTGQEGPLATFDGAASHLGKCWSIVGAAVVGALAQLW